MHNRIEISRSALVHNLEVAKRLAGNCCLVAPVVKGNAYGHGLIPVATALADAGADGFCVFTVEEGVRLRTAGVTAPILVMGYVEPLEMENLIANDLRLFLSDSETAHALSAAAVRCGKEARVHVKIDTGMGRFGVFYTEAEAFLKEVAGLSGVQIEGMATHFATSDEKGENEHCHDQFERFRAVLKTAEDLGIHPSIRHAANSAAVLRYPEMRLDMIRPGRMMYGYFSDPADIPVYAEQEIVLEQVIAVKSVVAMVKKVPAGTPISYSRTYTTNRESTLAVIPMGYAEGISRFLSNKGEVLIQGKRAPIRGRVCMNVLTVDVTDIPGVKAGEEVVFLGHQGDEFISCYEMAELCMQTLPYNILTAFQDSLPRILVD
jgi:alanine racemase